MTTAQTTATPGAPDGQSPRRSRGDIAVGFADQIAHAEFRRGDLADLRRMDPDEPDAAVFWRLLAQQDLLGDPAVESRWALILHGIALMTPTSSGDGVAHTAHNGNIPVGLALFLGGEVRRVKGLYSETRFNRLLTARGPMLRAGPDVSDACRRQRVLQLAGDGAVHLNEGDDEETAEQARRRMARAYYQAERRSAQASDD